jgi:NADH-quinone oxidoreductase subunit L
MFMACGVGAFAIGIFHVMTHAFFKALMFLGAGSVIHGMHHEQDMRRMGGLKKYMPKTYLTFLAGWLAICGIIPFSGFWSKDEILWNAASTRYIPYGWVIWLVGTIAATCTAFYMTRLVAMTFWGKERFLDGDANAGADQTHAAHGHGAHIPHESPPSMWVPLAVLAILAVIGGFVGISTAFTGGKHVGGRMNIVTWLAPVVWNPQTRDFNKPLGADVEGNHAEVSQSSSEMLASTEPMVPGEAKKEEVQSPYGDTGFNLAHAVEGKIHSETGTEWIFMAIAFFAAAFGMGMGWLFYVRNPSLPDIWATRLRPLYRASFNKYWVDELFGAVFTRRTMDAARGVYEVDSEIIDGAVNGAASLTRGVSRLTGNTDKYVVDGLVNTIAGFISRLMSPLIRAAQTGLTANYALVMVLGLVIAVALFFAKDIWTAFVRG